MTRAGASPSASPCLAIDIGATKVDLGLVHPDGTLEYRERILVDDHPDDLFDAIAARSIRLQSTVDSSLVGVACAGPMTGGGEFVSPLNIPMWREFPLRQRLREVLGDEVYVEGDARSLALAEGVFGAARDDTSFLSMVVSTGVGGGIVVDGRLLDGDSGNSGHIGHLNVIPDGSPCSCGSFGCLEAEVSGWAIESRTGRPPSHADEETRRRTGELVGRAVGSLCSVLDINRCYVAGSVALGFADDFFRAANEVARAHAQMSYSRSLQIRPSALGPDGPLLGAAMVGWRAT
ncbi:MAG TPA: ROK family protein [Acidimicrobiales bacterium]|nr:ROK family protein [Acidimicrobiales bacterium]